MNPARPRDGTHARRMRPDTAFDRAAATAPIAPGTDADLPLQAEVSARLLHTAYGRLPTSLLITAAATIVFLGVTAARFPLHLSTLWAAAILLSVGLRYALYRAYRRADPGPESIAAWGWLYLIGSAATGLAWTSGAVRLVDHGAGSGLPLLVGTLLSVCAVAVNSQAAQRGAMQAFIVAALAPFALAVWFTADAHHAELALLLLAAMLAIIVVGRASHRGIRELVATQARLVATAEQAGAARGRAEAASSAKTRFLANMSHELRTPLNAVIGAAQLLRAEQADPEQQAQLVDAIQRSGTNLLGLIENTLDIARIEAGELSLRPVDFHLVECLDSALASAGLSAQAKGVQLACIVDPDLPAWRRGDADRLRQVVMNLLGNAVKFTATGEIVVRVVVGQAPHAVRISVTDTGVGIEAAALAHVFEPFRQADEGADRRYGGSGLGLAIVKQLVEAQGGWIAVSSQVAQGSCFEFEIPLPLARGGVADPAPLRHGVVFHEPHEPSAQALHAHLLRMGCVVRRCTDAATVRDCLAAVDSDAPPWLLIAADAPQTDELLEAVVDLIDPGHVIAMTDRSAFDAERLREAMHLPRQLVRPVTRTALVSRMAPTSVAAPAAAPVPQDLMTAAELDALTHVLVVEDDELNRTIVCRLLQHGGHRVSAAADGGQALQMLRNLSRVDLVLMDWQMPDMDGLEVTRRLRAGEAGDAGRRVPIVALTANAFAEDRDACLAAGMNDFLTKPVQTARLMAAVKRWAPGGQARPAAARTTRAASERLPERLPERPHVPVFDPSVLAALPMVADGSDPGYARELLTLFLDGSSKALADIERATLTRDTPALLRLVHTLKSSSASVGALELADLAATQEARLRQGRSAEADLPAHLRTSLQRLGRASEQRFTEATEAGSRT